MMTDREYEEFSIALSKKYLRTYDTPYELEQARRHVERLMSTSRLLRAIHERAENDNYYRAGQNSTHIYQALGNEFRHSAAESSTYLSNTALNTTGILQALDDSSELLLANLRRSAIPREDLDMLRRCGIEDPEAEITILIHQARASTQFYTRPSEALEQATGRLYDIGKKMEQGVHAEPTKRRKILNGVGNLLTGFVTAGGNALLIAGTIAAPNPATGFAALSSAAMGVQAIFKGLGDLSGE